MYIHMEEDYEKILSDISKKLELINKNIDKVMPKVLIKEASSFGNSSHVVLSKDFVDKKIGILILGEMTKR